jgi:NAD+ synthetase
MKIHNPQNNEQLHSELVQKLNKFRINRGFNPALYIEAKIRLINSYMKNAGLKSCVIGVSGGIDSAVTLAILNLAAKEKNSPIIKIVPVLLPVLNSNGVTNQSEATIRGKEVSEKLGLTPVTIDLSNAHSELQKEIDSKLQIVGQPWATGQLVPYLRTPSLYYITSLLSQEKLPAIVCGTINKSEGSYLGYFGKASDGMVDLQIISDLYKSEVYSIGQFLSIPDSIMNVSPNGDMFDGRVDEEVFGAPYDFVEIYLEFLTLNKSDQLKFMNEFNSESKDQFDFFAKNLEALHSYNKHKYLVGSPAVHLDIYDGKTPGGWDHSPKIKDKELDMSKIVGHFNLTKPILSKKQELHTKKKILDTNEENQILIENVLNKKECDDLLKTLQTKSWIPVGLDGYKNKINRNKEPVGSYRVSTLSDELAILLWNRLKSSIPSIKITENPSNKDFDDCSVWVPVGVSSLFRFIKYKKGGALVPHYDSPYVYNENKRTLMSCVIYLNKLAKNIGGETRFIKDPLRDDPDNNYNDWNHLATPKDVLLTVTPQLGSALIFDHRILHDSQALLKTGEKIIVRTDIVFEKRELKYGK